MRTTVGINQCGEPGLVVHSKITDAPLVLQAVATRSREQFEAYARSAARADIMTRWNPVRGPIYQLRLLRRSAEEHVLLGTFDHLTFDDRAVELFFHYLWSYYSSSSNIVPDAGTTESPIDLVTSIKAERERYGDRARGINAEYWDRLYAQVRENCLSDQNNGSEYECAYTSLWLNRDSAEAMRSAVAGVGASMFTAYVSAFAWAAFNLTKRERLTIYMPLDNRRPADRWVIGNFACVRPIIVHRTEGTAASYLEQVAGQLLRSLAHRHMDGASERRAEKAAGSVGLRRPLSVNYMRADGAEVLIPPKTGLTIEHANYAPNPSTRSAAAMILGVRDESHRVRLSLRYTEGFLSGEQAHAALSSCVTQLMELGPRIHKSR
jgi:hypothetical protein